MYNNDQLIRIRYALDIKNTDMVEIFKLGGVDISKEDVMKMLTKPVEDQEDDIDSFEDIVINKDHIKCDNPTLDAFFNGIIIFTRGKQEPKPGQEVKPIVLAKDGKTMNNIMLKKLKIALSLTSEDVLQLMQEGGVTVTKGELGAIFRKEGERNYKECGDKYARKFLKGLTLRYRKDLKK